MSKEQKVDSKELEQVLHRAIKKVTEDIERLRYNTAISSLMILLNEFERNHSLPTTHYSLFLKLLAPFAPHISEELWHAMGNKTSIHKESWPTYDSELIKEDTFTLVIQVNGRVRDSVALQIGTSEREAQKLALSREKIKNIIGEGKVKKAIFIKDKLINFVVS